MKTACTVLVLLCVMNHQSANCQTPDSLTVDWMNGSKPWVLSSTPTFQWLSDDRLIISDRSTRGSDHPIEALNPATGKRNNLFDAVAALKSLQVLLGPHTPQALPFPSEINQTGSRAAYLFDDDVFVLDCVKSTFARVTHTPETEKCLSFSPDGKSVAFVRSNNLYVQDLEKGCEIQLTRDGGDSLLNGTLSWLYWEEVFGRHDRGYWWSGDSKSIAFFQTDESGVSVQHYVDVHPWTPGVLTQRYPKVGERNPVVRVGVADIGRGSLTWLQLPKVNTEYVVRVDWLPDNKRVSVQTMNRMQTSLDLYFADCSTGALTSILTERDSAWVNILDDIYFFKDNKRFLWGSERDGYEHLYLYSMDGKLESKLTEGSWALRASGNDVSWLEGGLAGVDDQHGKVYFTSLEKSSIERQLYVVGIDGKGLTRLTTEDGSHGISMSPSGSMYVDRHSSGNRPPDLSLHAANGRTLMELSGPDIEQVHALHLTYPTYSTISTRDGFPMPAQILKPDILQPGRKYPVIFYVYSGPSAPVVANAWQRDIFWNNILLQHGYIVVSCDNRSATGMSKRLENTIAHQLSGYGELRDLVDAVRWVKQLPYVDSNRVGIWGWSGGGSCTLSAMTRTTEFKAGIDVAGVTDFRYYDSKFAEQFMKTESENKLGFDENALVRSAKDLHGRLLMVHGTYDDNVHIQNTWAFVDELIKANKQFDMMIYPMRMHGISDRPARIHLYSTMLDFWLRNL